MQQTNARPDWAFFQLLVFKRNAEILTVECEFERAFVHVEADAEDSSFLERLSVFNPLSVRTMS
jgi:hypothetical protein